jgi:hypothetical protein
VVSRGWVQRVGVENIVGTALNGGLTRTSIGGRKDTDGLRGQVEALGRSVTSGLRDIKARLQPSKRNPSVFRDRVYGPKKRVFIIVDRG